MKIEINLVGWSRGATAAVEVARRLKADGIYCCKGKPVSTVPAGRNRGHPSIRSANLYRPQVNFLGLYDAVEMVFNISELWPGDQGFPNSISNAEVFFHAMKTKSEFLFPTTDFNHPDQVAFNLLSPRYKGIMTGNGYMKISIYDTSHNDIGVNPTNSNAHREMIRRAVSAGVQLDTNGFSP